MFSTSYHHAREQRTAGNFTNAADTWLCCPDCGGEGHLWGHHDDIDGDTCPLCDGEGGADGEWLCNVCDAVCDDSNGCADCRASTGENVGAYLWISTEWVPSPSPSLPVLTAEGSAAKREADIARATAHLEHVFARYERGGACRSDKRELAA